jgi:hypothetical protein
VTIRLSNQSQAAFVDGQNSKFEVFLIAVSISLTFHRFDLVVRPFQWTRRDGVVEPRQDPLGMSLQGFGEGLQLAQAGRLNALMSVETIAISESAQRCRQISRVARPTGRVAERPEESSRVLNGL